MYYLRFIKEHIGLLITEQLIIGIFVYFIFRPIYLFRPDKEILILFVLGFMWIESIAMFSGYLLCGDDDIETK